MMLDLDVFNINDIVTCKIHRGYVVNRTDDVYDDTITLKIIGVKRQPFEVDEFVVYVPEYELARLQTGAHVNSFLCKEFDIDPRFVGDSMTFIRMRHIVNAVYKADGERCDHCQDFFDLAAPNQEDDTFLCRACIENPWR